MDIQNLFCTFERAYKRAVATKKVEAIRNIITYYGDITNLTDEVLNIHYSINSLREDDAVRAVKNKEDDNFVSIITVGGTSEEKFKVISKALYKNSTQLENLERFIQSAGYMAAVGTNLESRGTTIVIGDTNPIYLSDKLVVELGTILPVGMPWLRKGTPPAEWIAFAQSIAEKNYDAAYVILENNNEIQMSKESLLKLKSCLEQRYKDRIANTDREIDAIRRKIRDYEAEIANRFQQMETLTLQREGMLAGGVDEKIYNEVIDYMGKSKMSLISVNQESGNSKITVRVEGELGNFDFDLAKRMIGNVNGVIYNAFPDHLKKKVKKIFLDTFIERKYKMRTFSEISVMIPNGDIHKGSSRTGWFRGGRVHNPHIYEYDCFGNSRTNVREYAQSGNYMGMFMQVKAQAQNLNFADSTVMQKFSSVLKNNMNEKIFEDSEGNTYSLEELIATVEEE